jgi:hypothetical protein
MTQQFHPRCRPRGIKNRGSPKYFCIDGQSKASLKNPRWKQPGVVGHTCNPRLGGRGRRISVIPFYFLFFLLLPLLLLLWWDWGSKSGLPTCKAGSVPLEPLSQSILLWLFWRRGLEHYLLGLTSNLNSPHFSLPSSWDYRGEQL